jgi:anti-sigma regulatory factor (Ser/Thr protein kinase)
VVALVARHDLDPDTLEEIALVADAVAQGVERKRAEAALAESQRQTRSFLRDVLASVTEGRLRLCDTAGDLPEPLRPFGEPVPLTRTTLRAGRSSAAEAARAAGLDGERANDLLTAVGEAALNAVMHAGGGTLRAFADGADEVAQIWVEDRGGGIAVESLPQATLERGFTTGGEGFGHGFWLMLKTIDRVYLLTGPDGTTVVLEQGRAAPRPGWMAGV